MTTSTMNISLPEALKRYVRERSKAANYSNPSDYVRSLIREDQRRQAAESLLREMVSKYLTAHPGSGQVELDKLRSDFWTRWNTIKTEIDLGLLSLDSDGGRQFDKEMAADIKRRGHGRLAHSKPV